MSKTPPSTPEELNSPYNHTVIAGLIKNKRLSEGKSYRELAREIGISSSTIANWEQGRVDPTSIRLLNWLFSYEGDPELESWRSRALRAEATLKDITQSIIAHQQLNRTQIPQHSPPPTRTRARAHAPTR